MGTGVNRAREKKTPDPYLEKRCLNFPKTEGVEDEANNVDRDDRKEFLGSEQVPVWNLYFRREQSRDVKKDHGDDQLEEEEEKWGIGR
jgi:hypothetical protein